MHCLLCCKPDIATLTNIFKNFMSHVGQSAIGLCYQGNRVLPMLASSAATMLTKLINGKLQLTP